MMPVSERPASRFGSSGSGRRGRPRVAAEGISHRGDAVVSAVDEVEIAGVTYVVRAPLPESVYCKVLVAGFPGLEIKRNFD
jgi:hypothetical protein